MVADIVSVQSDDIFCMKLGAGCRGDKKGQLMYLNSCALVGHTFPSESTPTKPTSTGQLASRVCRREVVKRSGEEKRLRLVVTDVLIWFLYSFRLG